MQMIWLLGAAAPAKKVHFNLNGSELRGFPIKARFGQSSILYANPLAPKQWPVSASVLLSLPGANVRTGSVCQSGPFGCGFLPHICSCHPYSGLTHTHPHTHTLPLTFHFIIS